MFGLSSLWVLVSFHPSIPRGGRWQRRIWENGQIFTHLPLVRATPPRKTHHKHIYRFGISKDGIQWHWHAVVGAICCLVTILEVSMSALRFSGRRPWPPTTMNGFKEQRRSFYRSYYPSKPSLCIIGRCMPVMWSWSFVVTLQALILRGGRRPPRTSKKWLDFNSISPPFLPTLIPKTFHEHINRSGISRYVVWWACRAVVVLLCCSADAFVFRVSTGQLLALFSIW